MDSLDRQAQLSRLAQIISPDGPGPMDVLAIIGSVDKYDSDLRLAALALLSGVKPIAVADASPQIMAELAGVNPGGPGTVADAARLSNRWQVLGVDELLRPVEPPRHLVKGILRIPSLVCFYGSPGDLKSMLLADLAVAVASGLDWLPPLRCDQSANAYTVSQGAVLWIDLDQGRARLVERFGALLRERHLDRAMPPLYAVSLPNPPLNLADRDEASLLAELITSLGARLVIVDNLGTASGGCDENSSQMVAVMANARAIVEKTGCCLVLVHHPRKGYGQSGGRAGDRLRGHSSIEASLDLAILVERDGDTVTLRATKSRDLPFTPFKARWSCTNRPDGALVTAAFHLAGVLANPSPPYVEIAEELPDLVDTLVATQGSLPNQSALREAIVAQLGVTDKVGRRAIDYAEEQGWLIAESEGDHRGAPKRYRSAR